MNKLYYLGHASLRITTSEGKVIYIDPYDGDDYDKNADLLLITHDHYDHNDISKIKNKNSDFKIITFKEALEGGKHNSFDLGYVFVKSVEAGYNKYHDEKKCVGYILTFSNGVKVYICGDTYLTPQMEKLSDEKIDYALFPCDGVYTMTVDEAVEASRKVNAKHNIPYHMSPGNHFSSLIADKFYADNKLVIKPGEEIDLK